MAHFELEDGFNDQAKIKVIGVGGAGGNAVNTMIEAKVPGVEFIAANTDVQALERTLAPIALQLGRQVTRGLGAGANPERGREALYEKLLRLNAEELVHGAYALEGDHVILIDTLEAANLDLEELRASCEAIGLALAEHYKVLGEFRQS